MTSDAAAPQRLLVALEALQDQLAELRLPLELRTTAAVRQEAAAIGDQVGDYLVPRVRDLDAPLLAVVGGSTGAGKSTLVNALVGRRVTPTGVLRPTTRSPVLVHHPDDAHWFAGGRVLPGLARVTGASGGDQPGTLHLVSDDRVPVGLALLDAPDVDSVVVANRELAAQLLAAADLWIFVTTAARYADAVPWELLRDAAGRSAAVSVVLDRVAPGDAEEIRLDLARLLTAERLADAPLFVVPESPLEADGALPPATVQQLRSWLAGLASDSQARRQLVRRTLDGALRRLRDRVEVVAAEADAQAEVERDLQARVESVYAEAVSDVERATRDGSLLRGEVLARWQEFVGTGELLRTVEERIGRLRDRVTAAFTGRPQPGAEVGVAIEAGVEALVRAAAGRAAEDTAAAWAADLPGRALLASVPQDLARPSDSLPERAAQTVREWQQGILDVIRAEAQGKRSTARALSFGVNGLGVTLMVVAFSQTAGLTGAEIGIAAGTAVVGQRLLEAVFGDQAVRELAARARRDLADRVTTLLVDEQRRFLDLLDDAGVERDAGRDLRASEREVRGAWEWLS